MARKIRDASQISQDAQGPEEGVAFVKNHTNEMIKFPDGTSHKFDRSRTVVTDEALIEKIRAAAALPGNPYGIFEAQ